MLKTILKNIPRHKVTLCAPQSSLRLQQLYYNFFLSLKEESLKKTYLKKLNILRGMSDQTL